MRIRCSGLGRIVWEPLVIGYRTPEGLGAEGQPWTERRRKKRPQTPMTEKILIAIGTAVIMRITIVG
jgi:hypothetical protein